MIWDCVMFRNELDVLQMRLEELEPVDAVTVVVEATVDHQGHPKPLHFTNNRDRFAGWADRIRHIVVTDLPDHPNPWIREHAQRDAASAALEAAAWDDLVLIADVDEIPSPEVFKAVPGPVLTLEQQVMAFAVDWAHIPEPTSVLTTAAYAQPRSLAAIRDGRAHYPILRDGGWHFSWLGGSDACTEKLSAFCHTEATEVVRQGIESGDFIERGLWNVAPLRPVNVDETWPRFIHERRCPPEWFRPR